MEPGSSALAIDTALRTTITGNRMLVPSRDPRGGHSRSDEILERFLCAY